MTEKAEGRVEIEIDGKMYKGAWKVAGSLIAVQYGAGIPEMTQLGHFTPEEAARLLLNELVRKSLTK